MIYALMLGFLLNGFFKKKKGRGSWGIHAGEVERDVFGNFGTGSLFHTNELVKKKKREKERKKSLCFDPQA